MEIETDEMRLESLELLGAKRVLVNGQPIIALFDNEFALLSGAVDVESRQPMLTCRTCDVEGIGIQKGMLVEGLPKLYKVDRHEPDGTGMSTVLLKSS